MEGLAVKNVTLRKQSSRSGSCRETAELVLRKEEFCTQQNSLQHAEYMKMVLHIRRSSISERSLGGSNRIPANSGSLEGLW